MVPTDSSNWADIGGLLQWRARSSPARRAYVFLDQHGREQDERTYSGLLARAVAIAHALLSVVHPGERAALMFDPGLAFIDAFLGCMIAGVIAVPMMPPRPNRERQSTLSILQDCQATVILTTRALAAPLRKRLADAGAEHVPECLMVDELPSNSLLAPPGRNSTTNDDVALLQYTSGSTSAPKGVIVSHTNLCANALMIASSMRQDHNSTFVGWTPLYHDQGLIGNVLQPLHLGSCAILMAPNTFLQRPHLWIEAIHHYQAHTSGGPDYGYGLVASRIDARASKELDLGCWKVAFNGAEPIRAATMERFTHAMRPFGFNADAHYPCYGMAEATLFVTGATAGAGYKSRTFQRAALKEGRLTPSAGGSTLVSSGAAAQGVTIAVIDESSRRALLDGEIGEIWVNAPSVAKGYWRQPEETLNAFRAFTRDGAGPYLRTGDLGALLDGDLYVCGRSKDLIIVRGRNLYPQDLELTALACHPAIAPGNAIAVQLASGENERRILIAVEISREARHTIDIAEVVLAVRKAIRDEHDVMVDRVILLKPGGLPRTTSGKVRRNALAKAYESGQLIDFKNSSRSDITTVLAQIS
jgi:acyl-CoA synthetase (AMP-forming)/AMP-acid ligase II